MKYCFILFYFIIIIILFTWGIIVYGALYYRYILFYENQTLMQELEKT